MRNRKWDVEKVIFAIALIMLVLVGAYFIYEFKIDCWATFKDLFWQK